jgi:hypothetical protein
MMWKTLQSNGTKWCKIVDKWDRVGTKKKRFKQALNQKKKYVNRRIQTHTG